MTDETQTTVVQVARLTTEVYKALEAQCLPPMLTDNSTAITAAQIVGMQYVLKKLRDGFVVP